MRKDDWNFAEVVLDASCPSALFCGVLELLEGAVMWERRFAAESVFTLERRLDVWKASKRNCWRKLAPWFTVWRSVQVSQARVLRSSRTAKRVEDILRACRRHRHPVTR